MNERDVAAPLPRAAWIAVALVVVLATSVWVTPGFRWSHAIDFEILRRAGESLRAGRSPYEHFDYMYPQGFAYAFAYPLSGIELKPAAIIWLALGISALLVAALASVVAGARFAAPLWRNRSDRAVTFALVAGLCLAFSPLARGWRQGQPDTMLVALFALGLAAPDRARPWALGALLSIGCVLIKPTPLVLFPALALGFGWRFVAAAAAVHLVYVGALAAGGHMGQELALYTQRIPAKHGHESFPDISVARLVASLHSWVSGGGEPDLNGAPARLATLVAMATYAAAGLRLWWRKAVPMRQVFVAAGGGLLASPLLEDHHWGMAFPPLAIATVAAIAARERRLAAPLAIAWSLGILHTPMLHATGSEVPRFAVLGVGVALLWIALRWPLTPPETADQSAS